MDGKYYLQLYTVKNALKEDFKGTLKKVADLGYEGVEFCANYGNMTGEELNDYLEYLGLSGVSAHISLSEFENNFQYHAEVLSKVGCQYMVCPMANPENEQDCIDLAKRLNVIADKCAINGFNFAYHNHTGEFKKTDDGTYLYDILMDNCNDLVLCELDVCWLYAAGVDIESTIRKYAGKINVLHLKQLDNVDGKNQVSTLDKGMIDFVPIIKLAKLLGTEYFIVEQDKPIVSELEDIESSINFLKTL